MPGRLTWTAFGFIGLAVLVSWLNLGQRGGKKLLTPRTSHKGERSPVYLKTGRISIDYNYCQARIPDIANYEPLEGYQLSQIHIFSRHGDRAPSASLSRETVDTPWDVCPAEAETIWLNREGALPFVRTMTVPKRTRGYWQGSCNIGQLTTLGIEQMEELGRAVERIYLSNPSVRWTDDTTPDENSIFVRSTDVWRTIQAAQAFISALIPSSKLNSTARRIHVRPRTVDPLSLGLSHCPRLRKIYQEARQTGWYLDLLAKGESLARRLEALVANREPLDIHRWFDILQCRSCWGYPYPCCADSPTRCVSESQADEVQLLALQWLRHEYDTGRNEETRLRIGPLLMELLEELMSSNGSALFYYSAHDTTISGLLSSLETAESAQWPAYASTLLLERWVHASHETMLRFMYNGQFLRLKWCHNQTACSLEAFKEHLTELVPQSIEEECWNMRD
ncbi:hypothetical protein HDU85_004703 [Gaertneriomyces sp. JEL0708]|nr:hypothetical protein HDU85_004703 [Gaertneriomyces sp. JEL0708]